MIANLKPYPAMKDSGVPWLGEVPEHWAVRRLKSAALLNPSKTESRSLLAADTPVTFLPMKRVGADGRIDARQTPPASAVWNGFTYFRREDVLVAKITPCFENGKGACLDSMPTVIGFGSTEFHVLRAKSSITPQFLYRLTTVAEFRRLGADAMTGAAGQQRVPQSFMANYPIALPPLPEQFAIVRFLDHAGRRVRRYILAKQKLIKLLEEQKQAIIHRAVTRGLNPNVRFKPSGVEWLGDAPEHWEVKRCRYLFHEVDKRSADGLEQHLSMSQRLGLVPSHLVENRTLVSESYAGGKLCEVGDLVLNRLKAHLGVFALAKHAGVISPDYAVLRPIDPDGTEYFEQVLKSPACRRELRIRAKGIVEGFWRLYTDDFYDIRLPVPNATERGVIINHNRSATADLDHTVMAAVREISLLREYRTRLIADVVTGKLDVRTAAAKLPKETDAPEPLDHAEDVVEGDEETEDADLDAVTEEAEA